MNLDRTFSVGASDTIYVMAGFETKRFKEWLSEKIGLIPPQYFSNVYTEAGTMLEEHIVRKINRVEGINITKPPVIEKGIIRAHLDGVFNGSIEEIKTTKFEKWLFDDLAKAYAQQVWVQMYVSGLHRANVRVYGMGEHEYSMEYWLDPRIDYSRIKTIPIPYNPDFIEKYKRRIEIIERCFSELRFPTEQEKKCS